MTTAMPVADPWFSVQDLGGGILMLTEPHVARLWRANCFFIQGRNRDLLVDSGMGIGRLRAALPLTPGKPLTLFTTHSHIDHIGGHPEFPDAEILVHASERAALAAPLGSRGLSYASLPPDWLAGLAAAGFDVGGLMVDAVPAPDYDLGAHRFRGVQASGVLDEGAVVDLGDRRFQVLHLPGHSPGSIGLWEASGGTLVAGDAIYDGILVDTLEGADIPAYCRTMRRLRALPARLVLGGHRTPFGAARMTEIADAYLTSRSGGTPPEPDFPPVSF